MLSKNAYKLPFQGLEMTYGGTLTSQYEYLTTQTGANFMIYLYGFFLS